MSERQGRYRVKADANQAEIVQALQAAGYRVFDTHAVGHGFPDLCVQAASGDILLFEVKGKNGSLTEAEEAFHRDWGGWQLRIVRTAEDAIEAARTS